MNDFEMNLLASQNRNNLMAEADRHRRAHAADKGQTRARRARPRSRGLNLGLLFGRVVLF
jgi:hypothetical protein